MPRQWRLSIDDAPHFSMPRFHRTSEIPLLLNGELYSNKQLMGFCLLNSDVRGIEADFHVSAYQP